MGDRRLPATTTTTTTTATAFATAFATAAATTAVATATAATTVSWAFFTWAGFVHGQWPTIPGLAVEFANGIVHAFLRVHRHESKATWAIGLAVHDHCHFIHWAVLAEKVADFGFSCFKREIPHIHLGIHIFGFLADTGLFLADWSRGSGLKITNEYTNSPDELPCL
jgi:hypothetical protein